MIVDVHAHYVSPRVVATVQREGERYGARVAGMRDGAPIIEVGSQPTHRTLAPGLDDLEQRQRVMADQGIERQVLSPWLDMTGYSLPAEQGVVWSQLLNDSVAGDLAGLPPERFTASATVPLQDGRAAATELQRAVGRLGYRGVTINTNIAGGNLDNPGLDPFWAAAQEARTPIIIHPAFVVQSPRLAEYYFTNLLGNPFDTAIAAASMIFGGVCDRFPDLKVVLVHGGGDFPYQCGRLMHGWQVRPETPKYLTRPPTDYLKWFYYDTILYYGPALRYLAEAVGVEQLMLGSDYPFDMCPKDPKGIVVDAGFAQPERDRIWGDNCAAVFHLK
jgi:aminocarboxymuconate-semialdehyde decarboxylase